MVHLGEVSPAIWDSTIEYLQEKLQDFNVDEYNNIVSNWKKLANIRKFDRELFEKYGYFKPIILHPQFQKVKAFLLEHSIDFDFGLLVGEPMLPWSTSIIVLFMLYKRISLSILLFGAAFVFNVNPLKSLPKGYRNSRPSKHSESLKVAPASLDAVPSEVKYDHVLVGNDIATLYTAALLSRVGHRCCVLQSVDGPIHEVYPEGAPCAAPLYDMSVSKVDRYQVLLDAAQSLSVSDRVTFTPVGTSEDGFTSAVIEVHDNSTGIVLDASSATEAPPAQSMDGTDNSTGSAALSDSTGEVEPGSSSSDVKRLSYAPQKRKVFSLRVGMFSFINDMCTLLPLDKTQFALYAQSFSNSLQYIRSFLLSRVASPTAYLQSGQLQAPNTKSFREFIGSNIEQVVFKCEPEVASPLLSVLSAITSVGAKEGLLSSEASALNLALGLVGAAEGVFWPVGGYSGMVSALSATIRQSGGEVFRNVRVNRLVLEPVSGGSGHKATGVEVSVGSGESAESVLLEGTQSVVSGLGVLCTYTRLLPSSGMSDALSAETRASLNGLTESRPRHRVVYWIDCSSCSSSSSSSASSATSATDAQTTSFPNLGLSSTDYFEIGSCSADGEDSSSDALSNSKYLHIWSPSVKDPSWKHKTHVVVVEFDANESLFIVKDVDVKQKMTSSSDAATESSTVESQSGPSVGIPSSSSSSAGTTSSSSSGSRSLSLGQTLSLNHTTLSSIRRFADHRLAHAYPMVMNHIVCVSVQPIRVGGHALANTTNKFVSPISSTTDVQNFYLTGKDLSTVGLAGDIQSGWATANAVLGYTIDDLSNTARNVVMDLENVKR